ncbi:hypothetical protein EVG20_g391 [Dentipellis fragilis]|uniref:Uncharacterized protein n=1 Tax=Dentipellis fragilis TaxID=205917 RepID=A0A4Y9ZFN8_9AGAM|nr:hypothetical protein EVG20_g391 [Dentipellis fragilis]
MNKYLSWVGGGACLLLDADGERCFLRTALSLKKVRSCCIWRMGIVAATAVPMRVKSVAVGSSFRRRNRARVRQLGSRTLVLEPA